MSRRLWMAKARRNTAFIRRAKRHLLRRWQTDNPGLGGPNRPASPPRVVLLRTIEIGHPDRRPMRPQDFLDHAPSPAGSDHLDAHRGVLKPISHCCWPFTRALVSSLPDPPTAAQPRQDFRHPLVQPAFAGLAQMGQPPFTDAQAKHLREKPRQPLVTDRMRVPQIGRQTLDGGPKRRARCIPLGTGATYACPQPAQRPP